MGALRRIIKRSCVFDALLMGVGLSILANSRPYEGLLVSVPMGVMLFVWILSKRGPMLWISVTRIVMPLLIVLALTGAAMALYNLRTTGNGFRMPYQVYEETYGIAPLFLWQTPRPEPTYHHQVLRDFQRNIGFFLYKRQQSMPGFISEKINVFLLMLVFYSGFVFTVPLVGTLIIMIPWMLRNRWARFALLTNSSLIAGLLVATYALTHYSAPIYGLNYMFVLQALRLWRWRNKLTGRLVSWFVPLLGIMVFLWSLWGSWKSVQLSDWHIHRARILAQLRGKEGLHLIIVTYSPQHLVRDEWVYNEADIDNAKVVWARDMDVSHNCKLIEYFKDRHIWSLEVDRDQSIPKLQPYAKNLCQ